MKEKKKEMQKQVLTLLGILIFAFVNVFIFDNKMGAGFSAFSTITLMSIGLLSKRTSLRVLAINFLSHQCGSSRFWLQLCWFSNICSGH